MTQDSSINTNRIAKNTLFLYFRTIVTLLISLYTSRVVLLALGVDDYGIYHVVGGFVAMFNLLSGALSRAISRFITFELGNNNLDRLKDVFCTSITVQIILAISIIIIAEFVGIWFLNVKMNVPSDRMFAANIVFQCSLLTFGINLISVPYNACIIAHERMTAFAYVSILEALLKLFAVLLLFVIVFDRLIIYSILLVFFASLIRLIYGLYCKHNFEECKYTFSINKPLIKEMTSLAGWNLLGSSGNLLNNHGVNLLMNLFFGVKINAARGLANQVNNAVTQFVNSFTTAVSPQITKSYAKGEREYMFSLVMVSSKFSFFLMLLLAAPIIIETPFILELWLKEVPDYTVLFVRLTLLISLITTLTTSLYTLAIATGDIKKYQIVVGSLSLSCFAFTYLFYKLGMSVESAYYANIIMQILVLIARLIILNELTGLNIKEFIFNVIIKVFFVTIVIFVLYSLFYIIHENSFFQAIINVLICECLTIISIIFLGLKKSERMYLLAIIRKKIRK